VQFVAGQLRTPQDEPHLRAVPVADGHVPPLLDHPYDVDTGLVGSGVLIRHTLVILILDQRITPDGNYGDFLRHSFMLLFQISGRRLADFDEFFAQSD